MKKRLLSLILVLILFLLLLPAMDIHTVYAGETNDCKVYGYVCDYSENAISGATVSFATDATTVSTETASNGFYALVVPTNQEGTITVSKDGYLTTTFTYEFSEDTNIDVNLNSWSPIGGCLWIFENEMLIVKPNPNSTEYTPGQLPDDYTTEEQWPWNDSRLGLSYIGFEKGVIAGNSVNFMFANCKYLASVDLSDFDTSAVTNMKQMFSNCLYLESLDLSSFDTSKVTDMTAMFSGCSVLETIYVSDKWSTGNVESSDDMFANCKSIIGGAGTSFSDGHTDKEYARIDGGSTSTTPGYLTGKYTVTFDANGGSGEMDSQSFMPNTPQALSANTFTRTNYTFLGWNTDPDATTCEYTDGQEVTINGNKTLYAVWEANKTVPAASDFTFTAPASLTYDGSAKKASVTGKEGMGAITIKYYDEDGEQLSSVPVDAGKYTVKIDVAEGTAYKAANDLTATGWTFTIAPADVTVTAKDASKEYGAKDPEFTAEVEGTIGTDTVDYTISRAKGEDAGAYTITPAGDASQGNYAVTYAAGTFTVNPAKDADINTDTKALAEIQKTYQKEYSDKEVSVVLQVSDESVSEDDMARIKTAAGSKKLNGVNIELVVTVDGNVIENAGSNNDVLVSAVFKFDLSGKTDIQVLRVHDGELDELTETPNKNDECIVLDKEAGSITVKAKKYSTYAVAYNDSENPEPVTEYPVTFDSCGGTAVAGQHHAKGEKLVKPADPTKSGYTFAGWFLDKNYTQAWNFDLYSVSGPTTLYAKWTAAGAGGSSTPNTADGNTAWPYVMAGLAAAAAIAFAVTRKRRMQ